MIYSNVILHITAFIIHTGRNWTNSIQNLSNLQSLYPLQKLNKKPGRLMPDNMLIMYTLLQKFSSSKLFLFSCKIHSDDTECWLDCGWDPGCKGLGGKLLNLLFGIWKEDQSAFHHKYENKISHWKLQKNQGILQDSKSPKKKRKKSRWLLMHSSRLTVAHKYEKIILIYYQWQHLKH